MPLPLFPSQFTPTPPAVGYPGAAPYPYPFPYSYPNMAFPATMPVPAIAVSNGYFPSGYPAPTASPTAQPQPSPVGFGRFQFANADAETQRVIAHKQQQQEDVRYVFFDPIAFLVNSIVNVCIVHVRFTHFSMLSILSPPPETNWHCKLQSGSVPKLLKRQSERLGSLHKKPVSPAIWDCRHHLAPLEVRSCACRRTCSCIFT